MIAPVVGSRVTFAVEAPRVFGALEEGMARAGFWGLLVVGWEEGRCSVPPVWEFSFEERPRRW